MGQATCYIYAASTAQELKANVSWDSNYRVTINVQSNTGWRLKPQGASGDSNNIFSHTGDFDAEFQGAKGNTYYFQIYNQVDGVWAQDGFTLTSDSGEDGGGDENGGGDSPGSGGGGSSTFYIITLDNGGPVRS